MGRDMRRQGRIVVWDDEKGYGFIESPTVGRVFVHIKAFDKTNQRPSVSQSVTFALSTDKQGRPCAVSAALAGDRLRISRRGRGGAASVILAVLFVVIVAFTVAMGRLPPWILGIYLVFSLMTFIAYALDKAAAKRGAWRTSERSLHLLSLMGGWPGALVAQQLFRHKSKKKSFRKGFWMTALLNCAAFCWLLTPSGAEALQTVIASATQG